MLQVMNVEREGNSSVVTLDFFLEQDGELVAMETALQNLQSLTMEEMTALLEAPVSEDGLPPALYCCPPFPSSHTRTATHDAITLYTT